MTKIPAKLRLGKELEGDSKDIMKIMDETYLDIAPSVNRKPDLYIRTTDPTSADWQFDIGTFIFNITTPKLHILRSVDNTTTPPTATWTVIL